MRTILLGVIAGLLLVMAGAQLYLPDFVAARLGESLQSATGIPSLNVRLRSFPALGLLAGRVGRMDVSAADVQVDGLRVESLQLEAQNVRVDVSELLRRRVPAVRSGQALVRLTVTEEALTEYARARPELPPGVRVRVTDSGLELSGRAAVFGNVVEALLAGHFEPDGATGLVFVPDDVEVQGQTLPAFLVAVLREAFRVRIDLANSPFPIVVDEIIYEPGRLTVVGRPLLDELHVAAEPPVSALSTPAPSSRALLTSAPSGLAPFASAPRHH